MPPLGEAADWVGVCADSGQGAAGWILAEESKGNYGLEAVSGGRVRVARPVDGRHGLTTSLVTRTGLRSKSGLYFLSAPASPFHGRIDTTRVGAMGTSCGGLQAIALATDARVKTAIAFNSGVLTAPPPSGMGNNRDLVVPKSALRDLKGPIAYINGGPTDIAYVNAEDDLRLIEHVPVFFAENGVGHSGTYLFDANGGDYARVATAWFGWQLKGDAAGARWFQGADCGLCKLPGWSVRRKNFGKQ